ncbi:MAG: hypothetical protein IIZ23_08340 [Ruminococcus sp.]|nr:hypothetical protein [Ruminococcus sp.]
MNKFMRFMQGRYGFDTLNGFLFILALLVHIANIFVWGYIPSIVLYAVSTALMGWAIFRSLSRNINMRSRENRIFRKAYDPVKKWALIRIRKFKERKDFKYIKCPACKAQLRVKNQKGQHGVRCPKCRYEFKVKI